MGVLAGRWIARALGRRRSGRRDARASASFDRGLETGGAHLERSIAGREVHEPKISESLKERAEADRRKFAPSEGDDRIDSATESGIESRPLRSDSGAVELIPGPPIHGNVPPGIH